MNSLFPHEEVRDQQDKLLDAVGRAVLNGGQLVVHAPTGLGKTAAAIAPALKYGLDHKKTVIFLTSRHTQHQLALETIEQIKERHNVKVKVADLIGKKHYCLQPNAGRLRSREFTEYCKALREDKQCSYYENLKEKEELSPKTKLALKELEYDTLTSTQVKEKCSHHELCPYEVAVLLAREANVIVTDYNYLFNTGVAKAFMGKIGKDVNELIIIVDEAHNLPDRVKESASDKLSTFALQRAASEANKYGHATLEGYMKKIAEILQRLGLTIEESMDERYLDKEDFVRKLREVSDVQQLIDDLEKVGDSVREEQQYSYLGAVGEFLKIWVEGDDEGYTRILSESTYRDETIHTLSYQCLDPSVVTAHALNNAHASVVMSGTLSPTRMYKELLGVLRAEELTLVSPFPEKNRLAMIVPRTSTKFTQRSPQMYAEIAEHCATACNAIPGNVAVFFPSYQLLNDILRNMERKVDKTIFAERSGMSREEKHEFLERFKKYKDTGAVLLGVISGNYGEGVDLPGDLLRGVIVVGLPLGRPDLETKALIRYFDNKFGRGWEYGYTFPAFNKTLQSAGRCIRTEHDRGAVIFLDERYDHVRYKSCFPDEWDIKTTILYEKMIRNFFDEERENKDLTEF